MSGPAAGAEDSGQRRRVLLKDVARAAGVSAAQASAALSGAPGVRESTRDRVRATARDLGYQPSEHARLLGSRRRRPATRCAIVLNTPAPGARDHQGISAAFVSRTVEGITVRASELGMDIRLVHWSDLRAGVSTLVARDGADAVLVPSFRGLSPDHVADLRSAGLPFVLLNRHFAEDADTAAVVADVATGAAEIVDHLVADGHRRMAFLTEPAQSSIITDYHGGWRAATRRHGIAETCQIVEVPHADQQRVESAITGLLDADPRPTAIVAVSEITAHGILQAAGQRGLAVPRDLSVATFESMIAPFTSPALTGFDLQLERIGARGVERVAAQLGLVADLPMQGTERIRPLFVERDSTGPSPMKEHC